MLCTFHSCHSQTKFTPEENAIFKAIMNLGFPVAFDPADKDGIIDVVVTGYSTNYIVCITRELKTIFFKDFDAPYEDLLFIINTNDADHAARVLNLTSNLVKKALEDHEKQFIVSPGSISKE